MKRILVASDLSTRSDRAVERAVQLAGTHGAKIVLMHVIDDDLPAAVVAGLRHAAEETLAAILTSEHAPEDAELVVETGETVATIAAMADAIEADLVVLGTHRARPFWDMFIGTTMERTVRAVNRPVLLVVEPVTKPYSSILCGIDLSPASLAAGQMARGLAPEAALHTIHAVHVPYRGMIARDGSEKQIAPFVADAQERLDAWWAATEIPAGLPKPEIVVASVADAFKIARTDHQPDLLALGAHGRIPLSPTLLGGFTEDQIRTPTTDVLIVRG